MFETSQQEPSGGSTKTVATVVVAGVVVLAVVYFLFLRGGESTSSPQMNTAAASASTGCGGPVDPDAKFEQDLRIERPQLGRDQTQTMAVWSFQITNRSRTLCYNNLRYVTDYYDGNGNVIYHNEGSLPGEIEQAGQQTFSNINDGLYPLATTRYTIGIKSAEAHKAQ